MTNYECLFRIQQSSSILDSSRSVNHGKMQMHLLLNRGNDSSAMLKLKYIALLPTSSLSYPTVHCHHIIRIIKEKVADRSLQFKKSEQDVDVNPLPHHDDRVAITVAVNYITNDNSSPIDVMMKDIIEE